MTSRHEVTRRVVAVVTRTFYRNGTAAVFDERTTAADVDGWDSLSQAILLMAIEAEFGVELLLDEASVSYDVASLADLVFTSIA